MTKDDFITLLIAALPGYLRIDNAEDEAPLLGVIARASASWVEGGIGESVPWEDDRVMILSMCAASDMYDQRTYTVRGSMNVSVRENTRRLLDDFMLQLRLEGSS